MNRKITSGVVGASVLGGALVGASFVGSAGAYGGLEDEPATGTTEDTSLETQEVDDANVQIQDDTDDVTPEGDEAEGEREGRRGHRGGCNLEEIAAAIGIEEDALRAELESGQSIADVAEANGVDSSVIVDLLVDNAEERIAQKVEDGRITEEEAAEKLADVEERAEDRVERVRGEDADDVDA